MQRYRIRLPIDQCPYTYSVFREHRFGLAHFREPHSLHHSIELIPPQWSAPASTIKPSVDGSHTFRSKRINHAPVIRYMVVVNPPSDNGYRSL